MNKSLQHTQVVDQAVPLISVVLPVYNGEQYLAEAIDSILVQTFANFELIIIDDGSTDNSLAILKQYQNLDSRIRLIARENRNLATTLNDLIDLARGEWVARMDQDDIALPHRFERQLQCLEQTGADICGSWIKFFGTADKRIIKQPQTDQAIKMQLLFGAPFAHPTVMMKTDLVKQLRYDKAWEKAEDYDLWERAALAGWQMTNVQEVLLLYRHHATQISTNTSIQQQLLTQKIRRRYWEFVFDSMKLEKDWIDEVMKIREPSSPKPNMDDVDSAFTELLLRNHGEAQNIILAYVTRLYYLVAGDCPDVVARWSALNKKFGVGFALRIKLKLWLLRVLRIRSSSDSIHQLKKYYFCLFH